MELPAYTAVKANQHLDNLNNNVSGLKTELKELTDAIKDSNTASGELATQANRLKRSTWIAVIAVAVALGHLWVSYQNLIQG